MSKKYIIPKSNVGKGGFFHIGGKRYHGPSWIEVEEDTTFDDLEFEAEPFSELFKEEEKQWKYTSARSGEEYIVRYNIRNELSCSCWGYIAHRKCKHIKQTQELL